MHSPDRRQTLRRQILRGERRTCRWRGPRGSCGDRKETGLTGKRARNCSADQRVHPSPSPRRRARQLLPQPRSVHIVDSWRTAMSVASIPQTQSVLGNSRFRSDRQLGFRRLGRGDVRRRGFILGKLQRPGRSILAAYNLEEISPSELSTLTQQLQQAGALSPSRLCRPDSAPFATRLERHSTGRARRSARLFEQQAVDPEEAVEYRGAEEPQRRGGRKHRRLSGPNHQATVARAKALYDPRADRGRTGRRHGVKNGVHASSLAVFQASAPFTSQYCPRLAGSRRSGRVMLFLALPTAISYSSCPQGGRIIRR